MIFLMARVTLTIKRMIRLRGRIMTAIWPRTPALFNPKEGS